MKTTVEPLASAAWQLLFGFLFIAAGTFFFDGYPHLWPVQTASLLAMLYVGIFGVGLAHFLWWTIVGKLPAVTASISALLVPVVGVIASIVVLGEKPTINDTIGFVLDLLRRGLRAAAAECKAHRDAGVAGVRRNSADRHRPAS